MAFLVALLGYLVIMLIVSSTGCGQQEVLATENVELARTTSTQFQDVVMVPEAASEIAFYPSRTVDNLIL